MGTRRRVIPNSNADRSAERASEKGWAPAPSFPPALSCPPTSPTPRRTSAQRSSKVIPEYVVVSDRNREYVLVSDSFCKLLGYERHELIGKKYDEVTAPRTNDIHTVFELFMKSGYMHGIWILVHRQGTRILVRYESRLRPDGLIESHMELLGAGA